MSISKPGIDTHHVIKQYQHAKQLGTLATEYDDYRLQQEKKTGPKSPEAIEAERIKAHNQDLQALKEEFKDKSPDDIFKTLHIKVSYNENGSKTIDKYHWPFIDFSFKEAGIDEEALLEGVTHIKGDCNLEGSSLKTLGDVKTIGGDLSLPKDTSIEDLSSIKEIGGNIVCTSKGKEETAQILKDINLKPTLHQGHIKTILARDIRDGEYPHQFDRSNINDLNPELKNLLNLVHMHHIQNS